MPRHSALLGALLASLRYRQQPDVSSSYPALLRPTCLSYFRRRRDNQDWCRIAHLRRVGTHRSLYGPGRQLKPHGLGLDKWSANGICMPLHVASHTDSTHPSATFSQVMRVERSSALATMRSYHFRRILERSRPVF